MAITIQAQLAKKVPIPGSQFSSQQASITITAEVTDLNQVVAEAQRLYQIAEQAVDAQLNRNHLPTAAAQQTAGPNSQPQQAIAQTAGSPRQMNDAGDEYGPTSTVYDGEKSEVIRLDHDLAPVVGVGLIAGRVVVDPGEMADFEHYRELRNAVLLYPARAA